MAGHNPINIALVNMHRRNTVTHALLNSDSTTDIFLIQEPWFDTIGTVRQDTSHQGVDILGGVSSPGWEILYPTIPKGWRPKVMTYVCKHNPATTTATPFTAVPWVDISSCLCIQVMDVAFDNTTWRVINFYHNIRDDSCLRALMAIDIDVLTPMLVVGDFNTHSASWSPLDVPCSRWAGQVEEWAASNLLALANNLGKITHRGAQHKCDSVIDLAWYNTAVIQDSVFSDLCIDWEGSLGSDHTCLRIAGCTLPRAILPPDNSNTGFIIDPEMKEEWIKQYKASLPRLILPSIPTTEEVEQAVAKLFENIQSANKKTFYRRQPTHLKATPWWNSKCTAATQLVCTTRDRAVHRAALTQLKRTIHTAKHKWANKYIKNGKLWDVANWRHSCRVSKVPSLHGPEGIIHLHEEVAGVLSQRFFTKTPLNVEAHFHDDPLSLLMQHLPLINKELVKPLLQKATTRLAPGQSGHTWMIIK
jgi:Endonuclease-reverse transcriptase